MSSFTILNPTDNTALDAFIDQAYEKGRSEYSRLFLQNQGTDEAGDIIHYFPHGSIQVGDKIAVNKNDVFLKNGFLIKPGIIVQKVYVNKKKDGMFLGDEKYFRVLDSSIDSICRDDLIVVMANQGHRFNLNKQEYFFVQPDKVLFILSQGKEIEPGPDNMLLKLIKPEVLGLGIKDKNKGSCNGRLYYFNDALYDVTIKNEKYAVVTKKDIKLVAPIRGF